MGTVFNIQKFCIHDGDGIRTCVFLKGCPLKCIWCHNPEGLKKAPVLSFNKEKCILCGSCLEGCPARAAVNGALEISRDKCTACGKCEGLCLNNANEIIGREMSADEIMKEVMKDKMFYDTSGGGLTITGGEPSFQPDFTLTLLQKARDEGIGIAIETCGMGTETFYREAAGLGTTFLFDIKCLDSTKHKRLTGADNTRILSNLRFLMNEKADIILRLPMIPGCNDSDGDIAALSAFLKENEGSYRYAEIMPYHNLGTGKAENTGTHLTYRESNATDRHISRWLELFSALGADVRVSE